MSTPERVLRPAVAATRAISLRPARQLGISLIELIMFIIIVSIGVIALLAVFSTAARKSTDPMIQKQVLAIAESVLEEVESRPFTICDPDDANATTAVTTADCATTPEAMGPESETRATFDNVNDYGPTSTISPYADITGTTTIPGYSATVAVANSANLNSLPATEVLLVTVTVTGPGSSSLSLQGYRARYAPNAVP
jgi:MSHA pilin protein MshD